MSFRKITKIAQLNNYEFIHLKSTTSTISDIKRHLKNKNKNKNFIILADQQSKGVGRRGNIWHSPKGNIYCSISFNNFLDIKDHFLFSILIAVSIKNSLKKLNVRDIKFKWPNDLFFENKKFSGIISEIFNIDELKSYIVVSFGVNITSSPKIKKYSTTYVKSFCKIQSISSFLLMFYEILFLNLNNLKKNNKKKLFMEFKNSLMFIDKKIKIKLDDNRKISGIFKGISNDGSLKLENNNKISCLYNGTIEL
jgi:BirA family biotin operon repressor/biotin-[acetyl-CoA-carboxylase] ligase